jgi:hypothetical protein
MGSEIEASNPDPKLLEEKFASELEKKLNDLEGELRREYERKNAELEEEISSSRAREEKLMSEKSTIMSYYEFQNKVLLKKIDVLSEELRSGRKGPSEDNGKVAVRKTENAPLPVSGSVIRISGNEFKCPFIEDGNYSVVINAEMTRIRFNPDKKGRAVCRNGIMAVPGLNMICALGNVMGKLECTIYGGENLEIWV